jgi:hypothetical protein
MDPQLDTELSRLEREGNDDFHLLDTVGATSFKTEDLLEMRQRAHADLERFDRSMRLLMLVGGTSAGWVLGIMGAWLADQYWLMFGAITGLIVTILGFLGGLAWIAMHQRSRGQIEADLYSINNELNRRRGHSTL